MQLELVEWEPSEPEWQFKDPNVGMYDRALDFFWDYVGLGDGVDLFRWGTMTSVFFVTDQDVGLFPELQPFRQVIIWEDEEEGVKMFLLKTGVKCALCGDPLTHKHNLLNCDGLI